MGITSPIEIAISSRDYDAILATADDIMLIINRHLPEIENPEINVDEGAPQLLIRIDRDRAAALGVSMSSIANEIRTAMDGTNATTMSRGDRLIDVRVMLRDEDRAGMPNLDAVFVMGRNGSRISLSNVASIEESRAPSSIRRERQERVIRISGGLPADIAATDMQQRLEETVRENLVSRQDVTVRYFGEAQEIASYYNRFLFIIAAAIILVFGVMASQFESFMDPLIIFFSIPLLIIGVVWIYKITNQAMTMFSAVGIVALVGVVINNGIILVDYTNTLRARGFRVREACLEAGRSRLRPILMNSITTILAMVPIAFFPGPGTETIQPIARTFVGGLTVSSFMTLLVTPVMYSMLNSWRDRKFNSMKLDAPPAYNGAIKDQEPIPMGESANPEEWLSRPESGFSHPPQEGTYRDRGV
jgi:multidrug efflux pump subunit AcrB